MARACGVGSVVHRFALCPRTSSLPPSRQLLRFPLPINHIKLLPKLYQLPVRPDRRRFVEEVVGDVAVEIRSQPSQSTRILHRWEVPSSSLGLRLHSQRIPFLSSSFGPPLEFLAGEGESRFVDVGVEGGRRELRGGERGDVGKFVGEVDLQGG